MRGPQAVYQKKGTTPERDRRSMTNELRRRRVQGGHSERKKLKTRSITQKRYSNPKRGQQQTIQSDKLCPGDQGTKRDREECEGGWAV